MITKRDLQEAIAECEGQKNPNANTCIKLASYYILLDHMYNEESNQSAGDQAGYSFSSQFTRDSEFLNAIKNVDIRQVIGVIDELMETLHVVNPRLYSSVIRKLNEITPLPLS